MRNHDIAQRYGAPEEYDAADLLDSYNMAKVAKKTHGDNLKDTSGSVATDSVTSKDDELEQKIAILQAEIGKYKEAQKLSLKLLGKEKSVISEKIRIAEEHMAVLRGHQRLARERKILAGEDTAYAPDKRIAELSQMREKRERLQGVLRGAGARENKTLAADISAAKAQILKIEERSLPARIKNELTQLLKSSGLSNEDRIHILGDKKLLTDLINRGYTTGNDKILDETLRDRIALAMKVINDKFSGVKFDAEGEPVVGLWGKLTGKVRKIISDETYEVYRAFFEFRKAASSGQTGPARSTSRGISKAAIGGASLAAAAGAAAVIASHEGKPEQPVRMTDTTEESHRATAPAQDEESRATWINEADLEEDTDQDTATSQSRHTRWSVRAKENEPTVQTRRGIETSTETPGSTGATKETTHKAAEKFLKKVREAGVKQGVSNQNITPEELLRKIRASGPKPLDIPDDAFEPAERGSAKVEPGKILDVTDTRPAKLTPQYSPDEEAAMVEAKAMQKTMGESLKRLKKINVVPGSSGRKGDVKIEVPLAPFVERAKAETSRTAHDQEEDNTADTAGEDEKSVSKSAFESKQKRDNVKGETADLFDPLAKTLRQKYFAASGDYSMDQMKNWDRNIRNVIKKAIENAPTSNRSKLAAEIQKILNESTRIGDNGSTARLANLSSKLKEKLGPSVTLDTFDEFLITQ